MNFDQQIKKQKLVVAVCTRQYRGLTWVSFVGVFLFAGLIGILMLVYASVQRNALRQKVAEVGVDPEIWEKPLRIEHKRIVFIAVGVVVLFWGCLLYSFFAASQTAYENQIKELTNFKP